MKKITFVFLIMGILLLEGINVFLNRILDNVVDENELNDNVNKFVIYKNELRVREENMSQERGEKYGFYHWKGDALAAEKLKSDSQDGISTEISSRNQPT